MEYWTGARQLLDCRAAAIAIEAFYETGMDYILVLDCGQTIVGSSPLS